MYLSVVCPFVKTTLVLCDSINTYLGVDIIEEPIILKRGLNLPTRLGKKYTLLKKKNSYACIKDF